MARSNGKRGVRNSRTNRESRGEVKVVKDKFAENRYPSQPAKGIEFYPRTENQKLLLRYLREGRQQVYSLGVVGSGKSMVCAYYASEMLKSRKIDKIYLLRPNVSAGKSHGAIPGTLQEKLAVLFGQTLLHFEKFLGKGFLEYCLASGTIELLSIEYLRGYSFENCIAIVEESQGLTEDQFEMVMTRAGTGSQTIYTGDERQAVEADKSGLRKTVDMLKKAMNDRPHYLDASDMAELYANIGIVEFTFDDVQRSSVVKALAKLYYYK